MESLKSQILRGISEIAESKIDELSELWKKLFEPDIGETHMRKLLDHVDAFFTDIITETQNREDDIKQRIQNLNRERQDLKRLLKEDAGAVPDENVPLHTLQMNIDNSLFELREKLQARREEISFLLGEQEKLCNELEEPSRSLHHDPLPSETEMEEFRQYLDRLNDEKYNRFGKMMELRDNIKNIVARLEITLKEYDCNLITNNDMKPTLHNIEKLEHLFEVLSSQYEKMKYQIGDMRSRLSQLWKYLEVSEDQRMVYENYTEVTQSNYDELLAEVQRCEQIKKENIRSFIEKIREEIELYWDKCLKSDTERLRFPSFTVNTYNEDVLELHEDELRDLKMFYEDNEAIFKIIQERQELWEQMEMLQNKEADPKRYNNRGGQLLKEEKERKMLAMKLPKIETKLIEMVEKFEEQHGRPFTVYGKRVQDIIEQDYETKRQEKLTKSGKKIQATPAKTPYRSNMTTVRTPLTIEQTIINRTAMKTTGGKLRITSAKSHMVLSTTASSTASAASVRTENGKRRMIPTKQCGPQAKRKLLGAFVSPNNVLRQLNGNSSRKPPQTKAPSKNASLKVYNVGSCIKRRSRKSIGKKKRSSIYKKSRPVPEIHVASSDENVPERETTSYEGFENYVKQSRNVVRSSEVVRPQHLAVNHYGFASPVVRKPATPGSKRRIATPSASTPTQRGLQPKELEFSMIL
ncbi:CLUMA_CG002154, isoform A [Clunio marinus]|uniref:CLUMA_CG002154, isoform A n=1 Tax=Clunio marinus TaxID=568069 RepID=A0A1J1HQ88_9DIPT|nr:CLUMA_CG002154, isoform A [Clunio marinus]